MFDKKKIAKRLKSELIDKFGTIKNAALFLGKSQSNLSTNYLNGNSVPGPEILVKLMEKGCDIQFILTGQENLFYQRNHKMHERIESEIKKLDKKFPNLDPSYLYTEKPVKTQEESFEEFSIRATAMNLVQHWKLWHSLFPDELVKLSKINNVSLEWLLGYDTKPHFDELMKDYHNGKFFND